MRLFVIASTLALVAIVWILTYRATQRQKRVDVTDPVRVWQICRYSGGGNIWTPHPMRRTQAIEYASKLGSIMYVDPQNGFIFYRPHGHH